MKNSKTENENKFLKIVSWPLKVLVITFSLSFLFSTTSEGLMSKASLILCFFIALVFITIAVIFDMIALSATSCKIEPFLAMASRHEKGAKQALMLIKNSHKISTICADIVGDICGILSGTVSAKIILIFIELYPKNASSPLFAALISSIIAALTVSTKSLSKYYSVNYCNEIIIICSKILYFFTFKKNKKSKEHKISKT